MHAETAGGSALVPVLPLQRPQDVHLLEAVARFLERQRRPRARPARGLVVDGQVERKIVEARATLRSITFSSSRTLPGQS